MTAKEVQRAMARKRQRLAQRRKALGFTQESLAERLGCDRTTVLRWESAETEPQPFLRPVLCQALRLTPDELSEMLADITDLPRQQGDHTRAASVPLDLSVLNADVSAPTAWINEAARLGAWIESTNTSDDALTYLAEATSSLAQSHPLLPPAQVLREALELHERVQILLNGKQRLRQRGDLFAIQAGILAHICLLLGDLQQPDAASRYGDLAGLAAAEGGFSPAQAFSAKAQVARWQDQYAATADLAAAGLAACNSPSLCALLASQEANAAALAGDQQRSHAALARAAASWCPATESAWSLPASRYATYRVSVALHLGDPAAAIREAELAEQPQSRATWAHLRVSIALAHLKLGSAEGAAWAIGPVFDLPGAYRVATVVSHLTAADQLLRGARFRGSSTAAETRERIREFSAGAQAAPTGAVPP